MTDMVGEQILQVCEEEVKDEVKTVGIAASRSGHVEETSSI